MHTAEQILVIFISGALGIFLVLAITISIMVIRLIKGLQTITDKAGKVMDSAGSLAEMLRNSAGSFTILRFARTIAEAFMKKRTSTKHHKDKE